MKNMVHHRCKKIQKMYSIYLLLTRVDDAVKFLVANEDKYMQVSIFLWFENFQTSLNFLFLPQNMIMNLHVEQRKVKMKLV